jgi:hypothetical protein
VQLRRVHNIVLNTFSHGACRAALRDIDCKAYESFAVTVCLSVCREKDMVVTFII